MAGKYKNPAYKTDYNKAHYERIILDYRQDQRYKERVKAQADDEGLSVTAWILRAIDRELARETGDYREE